ncbi:MAG: Ig-like domain-containing protein [Oscillospiraceae bacterium]|nr:Ig-like domain-containing protein [Oscillospiraceae bacterium]
MNKTRRTLLSLVLALAMLLPMAPARAVGEIYARGVTLTPYPAPVDQTIYVRSDLTGEITVTALANPAEYNGTIKWEVDTPSVLTSLDTALDTPLPYVDPVNRSIRLRVNPVVQRRPVSVIARLQGDPESSNDSISGQCLFVIDPDSVKTCTLAPEKLTLEIGKSATMNAFAAYMSGQGTPTITYESSKPAVATVNSSGTVTGVSVGVTTITASAGGKTAEATVTVTNPTSNVTGSAMLGQPYSMQSIYEDILVKYSSTFSVPADQVAKCMISFFNFSPTGGTLKTAKGTVVESKPKAYPFPDVRSMYLDLFAAGTYTCNYTMSDPDGRKTLDGTVTVSIATPTTHIRVPVSGANGYVFSSASMNENGKTGAALIREAIGNFASIRFGAVQSGDTVGTLYASVNAQYYDIIGRGSIVESSKLEELYFTPARTGAYSIAYEAFSGPKASGTVLCSGSLIIPVDSASLDVTVNLESVAPYLFSGVPFSGASVTASAASQLITTINNAVGQTEWNGIRFATPSAAAAQIGTLYPFVGSPAAVTKDSYIDYASIASLHFVPSRIGAYVIDYSVYTDARSTAPLASGKLTLNVSTVPNGRADIIYTLQAGQTVALKESDFVEFFQRQFGSRSYPLSCVVFNDFDGNGEFKHDGVRFTPRNSPDCYTSTYTGQLPASPHYIDRLTFTAPNASGYTSVRFTCYDGASSNVTANKFSGVLHIYYTNGDIPIVSYNAYNVTSVDLSEQDFVSVYQTATKTNTPNPTFEIRLVNLPTDGDLYRYYSRTGSTKLTDSNLSAYSSFWVNGSEMDSISKLSYTPRPGWSTADTDTVSYLAFSPNGSLLFAGMISFKLEPDREASIFTDGLKFVPGNFTVSGDRDPVVYVTFPTPASGRYYVYTGSRYIQASDTTKFYLSSAADGNYPITDVLYVPKAIQSGSDAASIDCIAHRRSGVESKVTINLTVRSRVESSIFSDVNASSYSWASNSVDFARALGLVGGTGNDANGRPKFSPSDSMLRCHLILILYRLDGSPTPTGAMPYTDVPAPAAGNTYSAELYNSALWAYSNGIMQNVVFGNVYDTNAKLTRQEFAQILCNYTKHVNPNAVIKQASLASYVDADQVSPNTYEGVAWAVANGYITSAADGVLTIAPTKNAERAQIVTLLHRYLTY